MDKSKHRGSRRRSRRVWSVRVRMDENSDSSEDDLNDVSVNDIFSPRRERSCTSRRSGGRASCTHACRKATSKKTPAPRNKRCSGMVIALSDSDQEGPNGNQQTQLVRNRVDAFFKSNNLVSDDEDVIMINDVKDSNKKPSTVVRYALSDSDDDSKPTKSNRPIIADPNQASTSKAEIAFPPAATYNHICSSSQPPETQTSATSKEDDIMGFVDFILADGDLDNSIKKSTDLTDAQSFEKFRQETEEMLKNASSLIDKFRGVQPEPAADKPQEAIPESKEVTPKKTLGSCPICLEPLIKDICSTTCGHIFCKACINKALKIQKTCPTCRKRINAKAIHPLYIGL